MHDISPQILLGLELILFVSIVLLHLAKKNASAVWLYFAQSAAIVALLLISLFQEFSVLGLITVVATVIVKGVIAPLFFLRLVRRHQLRFSASTYVSTPVTLLVIAAIVVLVRTFFTGTSVIMAPENATLLLISIAGAFISIFLIVNRKGGLSQMLGVLSLENSIVAFAIFAGLEQNPALQLGIIFDICIWIIVASVFASMIYNHFGTLDVTEMKNLKE